MQENKRLFLIDGSALFYRSYFAFIRNPLINSRGENTSAIFGFVTSLIKIISDEKPDYIGVVFDTKEPTFRHKMYPEYKATRQKMPDDMAEQFPRIVEFIKAFNIPVLYKAGYEADDIIATLASHAEQRDVETMMVTGDKDFMQLISPLTKMFVVRPGKDQEIFDLDVMKERFELTPEQVIDYLALMGDSSDNIPGVPGVGEKTAKKLLSEYHSLDGVYENIENITKPALKKKLIEGKEKAYLSKELVIIKKDVPLDFDFDNLLRETPDVELLMKLCQVVEFKNLTDRIAAFTQESPKEVKTFAQCDKKYQLITSMAELEILVNQLKQSVFFVFDTETTGLNTFASEILGISVSLQPNEAYYIPLNMENSDLDADKVLDAVRPVFENGKIEKGGQNIKYDALMLAQHGISAKGLAFDTMIAHYLISPGTRQHNLDFLAHQYLDYKMISIEELIGPKGKKQKNMSEIPVETVSPYACEDADITLMLKQILEKKLDETGTFDLFHDVEMPLMYVLTEMEKAGVKLDVEFLNEMSTELGSELESLEKGIYELAGEEFNIKSPQQLGKILFEKMEIHSELNLRRPPKTPTGQFSTSESILERYSKHPLVGKLLEFRKLAKLKSTYVDTLPELVSERTGRLHASFNQTVAATGRLSSSDPNLQNIPIRTEMGRKIRTAFVPENPDDFILSADYSQIELRVMAHLSGDDGMKAAFKRGEDIHASTAAAIYNIPIEMVNPDMRRKAKEVNFGIIYGISQYGLAGRLGIDNMEARDIIDSYFARFPKIKKYMDDAIKFANENKYVTTILNRRRYIPEIDSTNNNIRQNAERMAINTTIQGSAADLIKKAMIRIQKRIEESELQSRMLMQVHDELVFEVKADELEIMESLVRKEMEAAMKLNIPLKVDLGCGKNWLEAH